MNKFRLLVVLLAFAMIQKVAAQDLIVRKYGPDIKCKVTDILDCDVVYKFSDQESLLAKSEIFMIIYQDGRKVDFNGEDLKHCKKASPVVEGLKGPNGRRPFRQLGFPILYREFQWDQKDAYRVGLYYSSGHIKETSFLGFILEFGLDYYYRGYNGFSVDYSDEFLTGFIDVGLLFKFFKNDKWMIYGKALGGGVAVGYFYREEGNSYEFDDYIIEGNYNVAAGVNYKLGRKVGIFLEGGYSRVQLVMFGLSFMRD